MEYKKKTITRAGAELLAQGNAQGKGTKINNIIITDSPKNINDQTDLTTITLDNFNSYKTLDIKRMRNNENTFQPEAVFSNKDLAKDYPIKMIGLLAYNEGAEDKKVLLAVSVADDPFNMQYSTDTPFNLVISMAVAYSYSENVTANIIEPGTITDEDLKDYVKIDELKELKISIQNDLIPQLNNKVTDNKNDTITVNGKVMTPVDKASLDSVREFAKYPMQRLNNGDDVDQLGIGYYYANSVKLVHSPINNTGGTSQGTFEISQFYKIAKNDLGQLFIWGQWSNGWNELTNQNDLDTKLAQQKEVILDLNRPKPSSNPESDSKSNPDQWFYEV